MTQPNDDDFAEYQLSHVSDAMRKHANMLTSAATGAEVTGKSVSIDAETTREIGRLLDTIARAVTQFTDDHPAFKASPLAANLVTDARRLAATAVDQILAPEEARQTASMLEVGAKLAEQVWPR